MRRTIPNLLFEHYTYSYLPCAYLTNVPVGEFAKLSAQILNGMFTGLTFATIAFCDNSEPCIGANVMGVAWLVIITRGT